MTIREELHASLQTLIDIEVDTSMLGRKRERISARESDEARLAAEHEISDILRKMDALPGAHLEALVAIMNAWLRLAERHVAQDGHTRPARSLVHRVQRLLNYIVTWEHHPPFRRLADHLGYRVRAASVAIRRDVRCDPTSMKIWLVDQEGSVIPRPFGEDGMFDVVRQLDVGRQKDDKRLLSAIDYALGEILDSSSIHAEDVFVVRRLTEQLDEGDGWSDASQVVAEIVLVKLFELDALDMGGVYPRVIKNMIMIVLSALVQSLTPRSPPNIFSMEIDTAPRDRIDFTEERFEWFRRVYLGKDVHIVVRAVDDHVLIRFNGNLTSKVRLLNAS